MLPQVFLNSPTLGAALYSAGFTRRVAVIACYDLLARDAIRLEHTTKGFALIRGKNIVSTERILGTLQEYLFARVEIVDLHPYRLPLRRFMWVGRNALLSDPELKMYFLTNPGKYKRILVLFPLILIVGAIVSVSLFFDPLSLLLSIVASVVGILGLWAIARMPEQLSPAGRPLRNELRQQWDRATSGQLLFWREALRGTYTPSGISSIPDAIAKNIQNTGLTLQELDRMLWKAVLREYRRTTMGM